MTAGSLVAGATLIAVMSFLIPGASQLEAHLRLAPTRPDRETWSLLTHLADARRALPALVGLLLFGLATLPIRRVAVLALLVVAVNAAAQLLDPLIGGARGLGGREMLFAGMPSGHAVGSLTIGLLAVAVAPPSWRPYAAGAAATYALLVGTAVVLLGTHLVSDVLAGWALVLAVAALSPRPTSRPPGAALTVIAITVAATVLIVLLATHAGDVSSVTTGSSLALLPAEALAGAALTSFVLMRRRRDRSSATG